MAITSWNRAATRLVPVVIAIGSLAWAAETFGQRRSWRSGSRNAPAATRSLPRVTNGIVHISYPDSVDLSAFVDYVSQTLAIKILYDDELKGQSVVFRPGEVEVPKDELLNLLRGILRMRDLALVDAHVNGWLRIVPTNDMQRHIGEIREDGVEPATDKSNRVVTQVVHIDSADMQSVLQHARSFLSSSKASIIEVPEKKFVVITDYESAIARAGEIIRLLDVSPVTAEVASVPVRHHDAASLVERVTQVLQDTARFEGKKELGVSLQPDLTGGAILLVGPKEAIDKAMALIERFDVPADEQRPTVAYAPQFISADRLQLLVENVVLDGPSDGERVKLYLDADANRLYVTAPPQVHRRIEALVASEDVRASEAARPLRLYRPKNRQARELIAVLSEVLPNVTTLSVAAGEDVTASAAPRVPPGPNRPPSPPGAGQVPPMPPAQEPIEDAPAAERRIQRLQGDDFVLSYDEHTNTIIAIGPREFHGRLEALLTQLDQRQPQVIIEMTLVAITFNDSMSIAVELANEEMVGDYMSLLFSSFGLSEIDLRTGARTLRPGAGVNSAIIGPFETPFLMRAIAAHGNSRVMSTPRILVADNTSATIGAVEEAPFTSINASDTVATTSFAGFESAGTTMTVTPHVTQGDHVALDYSFSFSNFTGGSSVGVPPPRTTNSYSGRVEVPDGHTVIVGGLVVENETDSVTEVPLLGRIPILGILFQSSDRVRTKSRVFAFIRPTVLRDDQFADLKLISQSELDRAEVRNQDFPESEYQWMR